MTTSHRILNTSGELRIEFEGHIYAQDELHEALWLVNIELRAGLPRSEQAEAKRQVAQYEELLTALREAGA